MSINTGIPEAHADAIAGTLSRLLADSYTLYLKTQNFHWNVTGPHFHSLHAMFEEHYTDLATAVDDLAERIRALGAVAPGSFASFSQLTRIEEAHGTPDAAGMVKALTEDHETMTRNIREAIAQAAEADDESTVGLLGARLEVHEKTAWMLRASQ